MGILANDGDGGWCLVSEDEMGGIVARVAIFWQSYVAEDDSSFWHGEADTGGFASQDDVFSSGLFVLSECKWNRGSFRDVLLDRHEELSLVRLTTDRAVRLTAGKAE